MTENDALMVLENLRPGCGEKATFPEGEVYEAYDMAISALEEIQQYREIGASPERLKELIFEGSAAKRILRHYQEIGTVEECLEAVEKQEPKNPEIYTDTVQTINGSFQRDVFECPVCGDYICNVEDEIPRYCSSCGQKLEESEE